MAPTRASTRKLFPVFVDEPSTSTKPTPLASSRCSSSTRPALATVSSGSTRSSSASKENGVGAALACSSSGMSATKKQSYNGLGLKESEPKKRRIVLRDVSQEYEVEGEEPKGFRDVPVKPSSTKLKIFVDEPASAPTTKALSSTSSSQPKKKSLSIYTSPTQPTAALPPPTKRRAPLGGGLGGGAKGLRA